MARKKKGKKTQKNKIDSREEEYKKAPHSFVFHRGHVGRNVKQLVMDTRMVMEPFTAKNLQARKKNVLKDFVNVAGVLNVSHFIIFSKTDISVNMKLCRLPRGPTLTFRVHNYSLVSDVVSSLKKPNLEHIQYLHHPLLVMNNFSGEENHVKLMSTMFQNMFPSINVHKVKLNDVRRCLLVDYNSETNLLEFRHYNIRVVPVGMSRNVKKLAVQAKIPNLGKLTDISDYVSRMGYSSESEAELDGPANEVILPQIIHSRGNIKSAKSAVRLTELGPRLTLQLIKIQEDICDGEVMYHAFIQKTEEELKAQRAMREKKSQVKQARTNQQLKNITEKKRKLEEHKQRSLEGIRRRAEAEKEAAGIEQPELGADDTDEDDDAEHYRKEVGVRPDSDTFLQGGVKRKKKMFSPTPWKKRKTENKPNNSDRSQRPGSERHKFHEKNRADFKSKQSNKDVSVGKKNVDKDSEKKGKKGKREGMTIQQLLILKKKKKMRMKEKKLPKYKRKLR